MSSEFTPIEGIATRTGSDAAGGATAVAPGDPRGGVVVLGAGNGENRRGQQAEQAGCSRTGSTTSVDVSAPSGCVASSPVRTHPRATSACGGPRRAAVARRRADEPADARHRRCGATRRVPARSPRTHVVVLTSFSDRDRIVEALDAGVTGYLLKDVEADELVEGIRATGRGELPLHPKAARELLLSRIAARAAPHVERHLQG